MPAVSPPISALYVPVADCVYTPLKVILPGEKPGETIPPFATETFPVMLPVPARRPPLMLSTELLEMLPLLLSAVTPEVCV